jgi:hypothetical protein
MRPRLIVLLEARQAVRRATGVLTHSPVVGLADAAALGPPPCPGGGVRHLEQGGGRDDRPGEQRCALPSPDCWPERDPMRPPPAGQDGG